MDETVTLYRPTGPEELALVRASDFRRWPARLPGQPIFYPVASAEYAARIPSDWNVSRCGVGFVTRFLVRRAFMDGYETHKVGGCECREWWIPAEDLEELNDNIVGQIEVIEEFRADPQVS